MDALLTNRTMVGTCDLEAYQLNMEYEVCTVEICTVIGALGIVVFSMVLTLLTATATARAPRPLRPRISRYLQD